MQTQGLAFRQGDLGNSVRWAAIADLLADIFGIDVTPLNGMGGPDPSSMAFSWFADDGRLAANLSAFALPMVINGRPVRAAGLQSGAVRPEFRGRGLFRNVTEKALIWCDAQRFEAILLYTKTPGLYQKHGFVVLPQSRFFARFPVIGSAPVERRRLNLRLAMDLALIRNMLAVRKPVSDRFAVARQGEMFLLNAWLSNDVRLDYLTSLDAILAWRQGADGTVHLLDVVAKTIPTLSEIAAALPSDRMSIDFVPDRLASRVTTVADEDELVLMMRGPDDLRPHGPIRLPELAHF